MKKRILLGVMMAVMMGGVLTMPVAAAIKCPDNCVPTSILGELYDGSGNKAGSDNYSDSGEHIRCSCDSGNGDDVIRVLRLVLDIMTIGVGILGVIGITIVGMQYLTAAGNEEKTRKAKKRIVEIVVGLALYALLYALLGWLLPNYPAS